MKVVFIFTNEYSPEVRTYNNVVSIAVITEDDIEKFQITQSNSTVTKIPKTSGQVAVFWE